MGDRVKKKVDVIYFKTNGDIYRVEEEYLVGVYSQEGVEEEVITNRVRYRGMDLVILDGGDGQRPLVRPKLVRAARTETGSKGFGRF